MTSRELIVVGISGGVDSAVAALLLQRAGFEVHGLHVTSWDTADDYCSAAADAQAAHGVARDLGIPLHRADFSAEYREQVFEDFLREYRAGRTPNPDVLCNRFIKFGSFLGHAARLGARRIATGHYARIDPGPDPKLLRAIDRSKDQTYFLHAVPAEALTRTLFPLGELRKADVRRIATETGLANHERPDSTGICFIGERPFRDFLSRYLTPTPGPIVDARGEEIGRHEGLAFFTLGQRSGIRIGGRATAEAAPWYVAGKDAARNALIVVQGRDHPLLWSRRVECERILWIGDAGRRFTEGYARRCEASVRHRQAPAPCAIELLPGGCATIHFDESQWSPAPGQYLVLYDGERCLGGAVIASARRGEPTTTSLGGLETPAAERVGRSRAAGDPL